jgi:hypothetical protein
MDCKLEPRLWPLAGLFPSREHPHRRTIIDKVAISQPRAALDCKFRDACDRGQADSIPDNFKFP